MGLELYYNGVGLHLLTGSAGSIQNVGQSSVNEPAEGPQFETITLTFKLEFFEQSWADNRALVESVRDALKVQEGLLLWKDENGVEVLNRTVRVVSSDIPGDGENFATYHQPVTIVFNYRNTDLDTVGQNILTTYQRDGGPKLTLGNVMGSSEAYSDTRFHPMRKHREMASGRVSLRGEFIVSTALSLAERREQLLVMKDQWLTELVAGAEGRLIRGTFNKVIRIVEFNADVNQALTGIAWSLTGQYTLFPNETDYGFADYTITPSEDNETGKVKLTFSGRIGANSAIKAAAKLAQVKAAAVPSGYTLMKTTHTDRSVDCQDGSTFIERNFTYEYDKEQADIVEWSLRITDDPTDPGNAAGVPAPNNPAGLGISDLRSGLIRTVYSGSVKAKAERNSLISNFDAQTADASQRAYNNAAAKAKALGDEKYTFKVRGTITRGDQLFQTTGPVYVTAEFSFEYQRRGPQTYVEVNSRTSWDVFGAKAEQVSGYIVGPTDTDVRNAYQNEVKGAFTKEPTSPFLSDTLTSYLGRALQNEETSLSNQIIVGKDRQRVRMDFSFSVHKDRVEAERSMETGFETVKDFQALKLLTTIQGSVFAENEAGANNYLDDYILGLNTAHPEVVATYIGKQVGDRRLVAKREGPDVDVAGKVNVFLKLDFSLGFEAPLAGPGGIIECEVSEEITYSGSRNVVQPVPDGTSIIQRCGITEGTRRVRGSVKAATEATARAWALDKRTEMLTSVLETDDATRTAWEEPISMDMRWEFAPQVDGKPRDPGGNAKCCVISFNFTEIMPDLLFA